MIYYWFRLIYVFIASKLIWGEIELDTHFTHFRKVGLLDCDSFQFMANSKYFYYMDFIRLETMFRSRLYEATLKKGIFPVIGSQKIIYKKPLKRWTKFSLTLIVEGWDEKWVYHSHIFKQKNEVCAIGFTKIAFWKNKKLQSVPKILSDSGVVKVKMTPPLEILSIFKNDHDIIKSTN